MLQVSIRVYIAESAASQYSELGIELRYSSQFTDQVADFSIAEI